MNEENKIERGIELLKLCQRLQSAQDGVERPEPGVIDKTKTLDQFAMDINEAITFMSSLYRLLPMQMRLAQFGRELERQGKISSDWGGQLCTSGAGICSHSKWAAVFLSR